MAIRLIRTLYWFKFHVNIITCSGVMTIFFYKGLTRNPEIGNTPVWVFPNMWKLGWVRDTKCGTNVSNEMLLNAAKCQSYSFFKTTHPLKLGLIQLFSYEYCEILKTPILKIIYARLLVAMHTNNICFLFLEKCFLPKPNFPTFRIFSILEVLMMC